MARKIFTTEILASADLNSTFDWAAYEAHPAKANARVASTANITLATGAEDGDTMDGVTLATGDRILLKNQTDAYENGIYTVQASGAPVRSTDANTDDKVNNGVEVYIEEGTANGGKKFKLATTGTIILNTTNLSFTELSGGGASTPTGTGFVHVAAGVQDPAAKLVENADVANDAAIAESKLSLASDAAAGTPSRRTLGTGAQQAAAGNHGHPNATTSVAGFMSGTDKTRLDNATASPTAGALVVRDANGRAQIAAPTGDSDIATKKYVDDTAASGAADADETTKGITMLSVAPVSDPVAVGDNDPRVAPFVASGASHTAGLVPDPGATPGSSKFLREDATWATPPTGTLAVQEDGEPAVNSVDTVVIDGATVTDNEDGSVDVEITPASVGAAEAVHTHELADVTDVTASAAELNVLDGITASTAELNYVDGVTSAIQAQLDGKAPASAGVPSGGTDGQVLTKVSGSPAWADPTGGGASELNDLNDVDIDTPTSGQVLKYDGSGWVNANESGGGGGAEPVPVAQEAHGLSAGDFIRVTGNNTYAKAQADSAANSEIAGRVSTVTDTDNFEYLPVGPIVAGSGWTAGEVEFLDPSTPGATTDTPPDSEGEIVKPVLLPINATQAILLDYVGYVVPGEGGGGGDADTLEGEDGSYYLNRTNHTGSQAISTVTGLSAQLVPTGGTTGQVLAKASGTNHDVQWANPGSAVFCGASVYPGGGVGNSIPDDTDTVVDFGVEQFDSDGFHESVVNPSRLTIPAGLTGKYLVIAKLEFNTDGTGVRVLQLLKNGSTTGTARDEVAAPSGTREALLSIQQILSLEEGDYIQVRVYQNSGNALAIDNGSDTYFQITRLGA